MGIEGGRFMCLRFGAYPRRVQHVGVNTGNIAQKEFRRGPMKGPW